MWDQAFNEISTKMLDIRKKSGPQVLGVFSGSIIYVFFYYFCGCLNDLVASSSIEKPQMITMRKTTPGFRLVPISPIAVNSPNIAPQITP
jgi:hypothetical protein